MPDRADFAGAHRLLDNYAVRCEIPVAWGEMDALGHVNNIVYFRYFESARMAYFERVGFTGETTGIGPILAETACRFRAPLHYPDRVVAAARVTEMQADRFVMDYAIASTGLDRVVATGSGLVVAYDYAAAAKAPVPPAVAAAIRDLDGLV